MGKQIRISRRQMLEPLRVASKTGALAQIRASQAQKVPYRESIERETYLSMQDRLGEQTMQISDVRKFVDKQIEDDIEKERIKVGIDKLQ